MFNGVFFHQTDIDVLDVEEVAHMEADLFFILLFIRAVVFSHMVMYSTSVTFMSYLSRMARMSSS